MKRAILPLIAAAAFVLAAPSARAQSAPAAPAAGGFASAVGIIVDSLHETPLANANIFIEGTTRFGLTDNSGRFSIDSIAPGKHRVHIAHPLLDTLGITLRTPEVDFVAGRTQQLDIPIPGPKFIASRFCTPAQQALGPAALV